MALSNKFGGLLLTTGNKSEYAVGYATIYATCAAASRRSRTFTRRGVRLVRMAQCAITGDTCSRDHPRSSAGIA